MAHEVRYKGALVARFEASSDAEGYRTRRLSHPVEGPAFSPSDLVVAPERPVALFCRGNLVDTFEATTDAIAAQQALIERPLPLSAPRSMRLTDKDFAIVGDAKRRPASPSPARQAEDRPPVVRPPWDPSQGDPSEDA